jgi:glycosyltransferase involved in cell wall biosynthesis
MSERDHRPTVRSAPDLPTVHAPPPRRPHQLREHYETWWARRLVRLAEKSWGAPALIYERFSLFCDAGLRLQRATGAPRLLEVNAPLLRERPSVRDPARGARIQSETLTAATRVLTVSSWLGQWAVEEIGCAPESVRVLVNGTQAPSSLQRVDLKSRTGNPDILIGFVGSMRPWHGLDFIPEILERLPEAAVVLLGSGEHSIDHPRVFPLGFIDPSILSLHLHALDVGIAPYPLDAPPWFCPLKLLDYRAHGVPIVTSDVGDAKTLLSENDAIMLTLDPKDWAEAIRAQATRSAEPSLRSWSQVCEEAIEGILQTLGPRAGRS